MPLLGVGLIAVGVGAFFIVPPIWGIVIAAVGGLILVGSS